MSNAPVVTPCLFIVIIAFYFGYHTWRKKNRKVKIIIIKNRRRGLNLGISREKLATYITVELISFQPEFTEQFAEPQTKRRRFVFKLDEIIVLKNLNLRT